MNKQKVPGAMFGMPQKETGKRSFRLNEIK